MSEPKEWPRCDHVSPTGVRCERDAHHQELEFGRPTRRVCWFHRRNAFYITYKPLEDGE